MNRHASDDLDHATWKHLVLVVGWKCFFMESQPRCWKELNDELNYKKL
ncbi:hypothetical protein LINPERPRIM_LOCUS41262 [Linum perenne]